MTASRHRLLARFAFIAPLTAACAPNDGARISADNFPMAFGPSGVSVCFRGDEQGDVLYRIPFNRGPHQMSRNSCLPPVPVPNSGLQRQPISNR